MGGIVGWFDDIAKNRDAAADPGDDTPRGNTARAACDWAAGKGGFIAGAPWVQATCRPYWDGGAPYEPPGEPAPPFEGGQCPGVGYEIWKVVYRKNGADAVALPPGGSRFVVGPITGFTRGMEDGEPKSRFVTIHHAEGDNIIWLGSASPLYEVGEQYFIRRIDGREDVCGNPPDEQPEPVVHPSIPDSGDPVDVTPTDWPGPPIIITFGPASPSAPSYGPITTTYGGPTTVFGPSSVGGPAAPGPDSGPVPGEPIDPFDGGGDDGGGDDGGGSASGDVPPEDDTGRVCVGMLWELTDVPDHRGGIPGSSPLRFYETAGSLQLRVKSESGQHWTTPTRIQSAEGSVVVAAQGLVVEGYDVTVKSSFGPVTLTPIYAMVAML